MGKCINFPGQIDFQYVLVQVRIELLQWLSQCYTLSSRKSHVEHLEKKQRQIKTKTHFYCLIFLIAFANVFPATPVVCQAVLYCAVGNHFKLIIVYDLAKTLHINSHHNALYPAQQNSEVVTLRCSTVLWRQE